MNLPIFGDTVLVEIENNQSLCLVGADWECAQFQFGSFQEQRIFLNDHRAKSVLAVQEWLNDKKSNLLLAGFHTPAFALIAQAGERSWTIDLYDTSDISPINTLCIVENTPGPLPIHNYIFYHYEPSQEHGRHFFAVHQNDPEPFFAFPRVHAFVER
jgi:hypothetical protein